jgi:hypothetical protein
MGVFTLGSDDEETLPIFSFEEEAETFLWLGMVFDLAGWGRRDFLRDFAGAALAANHERWAGMTVSPGLLESPNGESPDGEATLSRETGEERGRRTEQPPGASPRGSATSSSTRMAKRPFQTT